MTIYMVTHKMRWLNQECRNVYYYETQVGEPSNSEWQDIADEIRADFVSELSSTMVEDWTFYGIDYRNVSTAGLLSFSKTPTLGDYDGTSAVEGVATQVALLVSVKGTTTKPNRARTYLTGVRHDSLVDSLFDSSTRGSAETFIDLQSVLNAAGTNDLQRVAAQWNSGHTQVIASNNIAGDASVASLVPATQRRRRIGVGI